MIIPDIEITAPAKMTFKVKASGNDDSTRAVMGRILAGVVEDCQNDGIRIPGVETNFRTPKQPPSITFKPTSANMDMVRGFALFHLEESIQEIVFYQPPLIGSLHRAVPAAAAAEQAAL